MLETLYGFFVAPILGILGGFAYLGLLIAIGFTPIALLGLIVLVVKRFKTDKADD